LGDGLNAGVKAITGLPLEPMSPTIQRGIDHLPHPQNTTERLAQAGASALASLGVGAEAARGLATLFRTGAAKNLLSSLGAITKTDVASAALGGLGAKRPKKAV
jgi:hypothetical protein